MLSKHDGKRYVSISHATKPAYGSYTSIVFYETFTLATMDHKYSSLSLMLYSVAIDPKRLCNLFHFLIGTALTFFPVANSL